MSADRLVAALLPALLAAPLFAQTADPDLSPIRSKTELTDEDRGLIRSFVAKRVEAAGDKAAATAQKAIEELRTAFDGSDAFKKAYAATCLELIGPAIRKLEPVPAVRLLTVVHALASTDALPLLLEGLQDERPGVRATSAIGLRALRDKLAAAGRDLYQRALAGLKEAGRREKSRDTLRMIYAAMNYADLPAASDTKATAAAVLELLEERARQHAGGKPAAVGADEVGLQIAKSVLSALDDAERKRLTVAAATLIRHAIERYLTGEPALMDVQAEAGRDQIELRNSVERLVIVGEELLALLLKPEKAPAVSESMRRRKDTNMLSEWQRWADLLSKAVNQDFSLANLTAPEESMDEDSRKPGGQ